MSAQPAESDGAGVPSNGSAFSGVAQPCTATRDAWDLAILPRAISAQRCHVRCNGLLDGALFRGGPSKKRVEADQCDHQTPKETTEVKEVPELAEKARSSNQLQNS